MLQKIQNKATIFPPLQVCKYSGKINTEHFKISQTFVRLKQDWKGSEFTFCYLCECITITSLMTQW